MFNRSRSAFLFSRQRISIPLLCILLAVPAFAQDEAEPAPKHSALVFHNIQLHYDPSHSPFKEDGISTLTAEHLGLYKYGSVFSFLDVESESGELTQTESMYFELSPVIDLTDIGPMGLGLQPLQFNTLRTAGFSSNAYLFGPVLQFAKSTGAFNNLQIYLLAKDDTTYDGIVPQFTLAWETAKWNGFMLAGFFDLWLQPAITESGDKVAIITEPQLLWNLGVLTKSMDSFYIGFEGELTQNLYLQDDTFYFNPTVFIRADF